MTGIRSKHDKFFKAMMKDLSLAEDFLKHHLPKEILNIVQLQSIQIEDSHYIDKKLRESESDILFSVKRNDGGEDLFVFLLCEHQSTSDPFMPYRLLSYMMRIWDHYIKTHKKYTLPLPLIYPLVVYNGKTRWIHERSFYKLFGDVSFIAKELFTQPFLLLDVAELKEEELRYQQLSNLMLASLQRTRSKQLQKKCSLLQELFFKCSIQASSDMAHTVLEYVLTLAEIDGEDMGLLWNILREGFVSEYQEVIMNLREATMQAGFKQGLEQGLERGLEQGLEQGREEGRIQWLERGLKQGIQQEKWAIAENLIRAGVDLALIAKGTGLTIDKVKLLAQEATDKS